MIDIIAQINYVNIYLDFQDHFIHFLEKKI